MSESLRDARLRPHRQARKLREAELVKAGATHTQAYAMALEEAWADATLENERLWDQQPEATIDA
jgi:hypothetical protein